MSLLRSIFMSKNLDTEILEGGANLSGGEKQKIAITRALLSNPDVLILDVVCSNLDKEISDEIYEMLKYDKEKRITILISHDILPEGVVDVNFN